jgi:hypothetical protein
MATETKAWYQSKTIWFNVITAGLIAIGELSDVFPISSHPGIYTTIISVGNIILRLITYKPVGLPE